MNPTLQRRKSIKANDIIHDQFIVLGKLDNQKHSSKLYKAFDKQTKNFVVVKMTSAAYKEKNKAVTKILQKLTQTPEFRESKGDTGVPTIVWRGEIGADTITVTECLGPNLKKLFLLMDKQFSIPTIATIAIQVLNTLEYIHHHDYVCCNVMPKEILISLHKKSMTLFITDYKQARKVKSGRGAASEAVSHTTNIGILNKFSSVNLHLGLPASKKDDLESLAYILVYFFRNGHLFDKNKSKTFTKEEKMKFYEQQKLSLIPETFCQGLPQEMVNFMSHIKAMQTNKANEKIDYDYMRKLFKNLFQKTSSLDTFQYDWMTKARTYNLENGKKSDEKNNLLENSFRSDVNSMQSPFNQATDFLIELEDYKDSGPTTNNTDVVVKKLFNFKSDEYNPWGMDEFAEENSEDQPIHLKFTKISVFQNKIQTIEDVKSRSLSAQGDELASRSHNEPLSQPQSKSEHEESQTDRIMSLPSKPSKEKIEKLGSETPPVDKISNFGKTYMREKSMKAK